MISHARIVPVISAFVLLSAVSCSTIGPSRPSASEIRMDVATALDELYADTPGARMLGEKAVGVLVFPDILKGGFMFGAQYGIGALLQNGRTTGYYKTLSASYGLQAGIQKFGYALFFMDHESLKYLADSDGWEIGVGPSVVVVDTGAAKSLTTTTMKKGIYAFIFGQKGLMAGVGIQGSKITPHDPE